MGVNINGTKGEEKITFSCDHPGCTAKTVRMVHPHWYDRKTGQTYKRNRKVRNPIAYWAKVLRNPRRRNTPAFFLLGTSDDWPGNIRVLCKEHYDTQKQTAAHKPKPLSKQREREMRRYQEQRRDIFQ